MTHPTNASPAAAPRAPLGAPPAPLSPLVAWLVERAALDDDARAAAAAADPAALGPGAADPAALVRALLAGGRAADALRVVACALPPREGVWWASLAARYAADAALASAAAPTPAAGRPAALAALAAVDRWVAEPNDANRRAAWDAADPAGLDTPAGCVAAATFFAGGSVTPPGGPFVPPPAGIHVTMAATGVLLAAAADATRLAELAGGFAQQGIELVRRLGGWDASAGLAKQAYDQQTYLHAEASKPPVVPGAAT